MTNENKEIENEEEDVVNNSEDEKAIDEVESSSEEKESASTNQSDDDRKGHTSMEQTGGKEDTKTGSGLDDNVAGALCYLFGLITGIIFLVIEKENRFVRYHAWQSIIVSGIVIILSILVSIIDTILVFIPIIGWIIGGLLFAALGLGAFALWVYLLYQAYQGKMVKIPFAGDFAEKQLNK